MDHVDATTTHVVQGNLDDTEYSQFIDRAEKLVEQLGIVKSLERRFARIEECKLLWKPAVQIDNIDGVFAHLRKQSNGPCIMQAGKITWMKFVKNILPSAVKIEAEVSTHGNFCALVTATHADAPPILQWDDVNRRNPVSLYMYRDGSYAHNWNIQPGFQEISGITDNPVHWNGKSSHHRHIAFFLIPGAVDTRNSSLGLFPKILKAELREVRSVIEAHSKRNKLSGATEASACGLALDSKQGTKVRVTISTDTAIEYTIDRWD
jgi:hypothetical protein